MTFKLKDPHTLRIFISSPFNGMELERQRLSRLHWPQIESALASRGLQLRTVDMRWGITSESSSDSQVISICLKELDRSDIFIGFFGQRYGWHGSEDAALQDNFDKAVDNFPWVDQVRDKSVTELEFLHGHLNHPGKLPAVICFRDKAYDDARRAEGEAEGNKRTIYKFSPESDHSVALMDDLKRRVKETESQTLGIKMCYEHPDECADFMFDKLWEYLQRTLLSSDAIPPTERERDTVAHKAYMTTRSGLYVGGGDYFKQLDEHADGDPSCKTLTIVGEAGIGKSALISNWIIHRDKRATEKKEIIISHFIGSDKASSDTDNMMIRVLAEVHHQVLGSTYTRPKVKDSGALSQEVGSCLQEVGEKHQGTLLVLLIDGLNKLNASKKTTKPLFWLPRTLPSNVRVIVTLTPGLPSSTEQLEMLQGEYGSSVLTVEPLTSEHKRQVCDELLRLNSKSLSPDQLELLVSSPRTAQPLFLRIIIEELCVYGIFRQLTKQIENLLSSDGVAALLSNVIERLEKDYDSPEYDGHMVEEILCAICCCKDGIAEAELTVADYMWAPLYHSLQKFLINRGGLLGFAFDEFYTAVQSRYMDTPERKKNAYSRVTRIFHEPYKMALANQKVPSDRCVIELVHLMRQTDDVTALVDVLSDIRVFDVLYREDRFSLLDYWHSTNLESDVIARYYLKSLSLALTETYINRMEGYETGTGENTIQWEQRILNSLHQWLEECKLFKGIETVTQRWIEFEQRRPDQSEVGREMRVANIRYSMACFFCETNRYHEAIELHEKVLTVRKGLHELRKLDRSELGSSYHGLGTCYFNLGQIDESEKMFQRAVELQTDDPASQTKVADTLMNLANIYSKRQDYDKAVETFLKCIKIREEAAVAELTIEMSYIYNNLGLAYRAMKNYDQAEVQYLKALKVKEKVLGRVSLDVGYTLLNLGTLQRYKDDIEKALVYYQEALDIFKVTAQEQPQTIIMAEENVACALTTLMRFEEAEPIYLSAYESLLRTEGKLAKGLPSLHREMVNYYAREEKFEKAGEITVSLIESGVGNDRDYALLDMVDGNLPQRPARPEEVSIDAGLKRFPDSPMLLKVKLKEVIQGGLEGVKAFIQDHCEAQNEDEVLGRRHLITGAILVTTPGLAQMGLIVLEAGHEYAPDNQEIIGLLDEARTKAAAESKATEEGAPTS